jgi:hypothetical protein
MTPSQSKTPTVAARAATNGAVPACFSSHSEARQNWLKVTTADVAGTNEKMPAGAGIS